MWPDTSVAAYIKNNNKEATSLHLMSINLVLNIDIYLFFQLGMMLQDSKESVQISHYT